VVQAWCLLSIVICTAVVVAGTIGLCRVRGTRVVPGKALARMRYLGLFVTMILASIVVCLGLRAHSMTSTDPDLANVLLPILMAGPPLLIAGLVCLWRAARSLGRSVVFYNVRRDELALALAAVFRDLQPAVSHRLGTFTDEFILPDGRVLVHGAVCMSRVELIGLDEDARERILDAAIGSLRSSLEAHGRIIDDQRRQHVAMA
jgi:hypothetical protein